MGTCIPTHALLSALIREVERDGKVPAAKDLSALLELGISAEEIARALRGVESSAAREAEAVLRRLPPTA